MMTVKLVYKVKFTGAEADYGSLKCAKDAMTVFTITLQKLQAIDIKSSLSLVHM